MIESFATPSPFRLPEAPEATELVAKYFRGLGDPTRLRMLELLRDEGELSVGELVARLRLPQPTVSTHLACLRWCGYVVALAEGRFNRYQLIDSRVRGILLEAESIVRDNAERLTSCLILATEDASAVR